jgi:hypothetical protein
MNAGTIDLFVHFSTLAPMHFQFKNRGIMVPVYLAICFVGVFIIKSLIEYIYGKGRVTEGGLVLLIGIAFLIAGYWTYRKRDSFYIVDGEKRGMNEDNVFFYLSMELWAQIYCSFGVLCVLGGTFSLLGLVD